MPQLTQAVDMCCLAVSMLFNGTVWYPGTSTYEDSLASYFALQQTEVHPRCIVAPTSVSEISHVLRVLTNDTGSTGTPGCPFAIRGAGHATYLGASNIGDGVTVDLRGLGDIAFQLDTGIVSIGAGATWGDVYAYLDPLHRSVAGGRDSGVGVAGLTIGGGISYFGPRYGWACDTVRNFQVVLANGSAVNANAIENPDLLWALRGGGGNFGIITQIDMQTFPQGNLWGGSLIHDVSEMDTEIAAIAQLGDRDDYDEYASLIATFAWRGGQTYIVNTLEYTRDVSSPAVFEPFMEIPHLSSNLGSKNMSTLALETDAAQLQGQRQAYATITIRPTDAAINATVKAWNSSIDAIKEVVDITWAINLEPLPVSFYSRHANHNSLGLGSGSHGPLVIVLLSVCWSHAENDKAVDAAMRDLISTMQGSATLLGALDPFLYLNYAAGWQDPIASYGKDNLVRLGDIEREYDPQRILAVNKPGGFKVHE